MNSQYPIVSFSLAEKLSVEVEGQIARIAALPDVHRLAVMPDVHEGPIVPNGIAVATASMIYPELVGGDIGCGVSAIKMEADSCLFNATAVECILPFLRQHIPTLKQVKACDHFEYPGSLAANKLSDPSLTHHMDREGILQLGTLGRGNHFIELDVDENKRAWVVVHSGSRSMGQRILDHYRHAAGIRREAGAWYFEKGSDLGESYLSDAAWALRYANCNRLLIINRVADILEQRWGIGLDESSYIDSPHNFIRLETVDGNEMIVHRKSANSAHSDELAIIPGSMSSGSRIVRGLGNPNSLNSSAHGAGRRFGRKEAFARINTREFIKVMQGIAFDRANAFELRDEAPQAYRDIDEVMRAQHEQVRCISVLRPILNDKRA